MGPRYLRRINDSAGEADALPTGCVLIDAADEAMAAEWICGGVLDWLHDAGYDLRDDVQARARARAEGGATAHPAAQRAPPSARATCSRP